jgi:hypothetical protein
MAPSAREKRRRRKERKKGRQDRIKEYQFKELIRFRVECTKKYFDQIVARIINSHNLSCIYGSCIYGNYYKNTEKEMVLTQKLYSEIKEPFFNEIVTQFEIEKSKWNDRNHSDVFCKDDIYIHSDVTKSKYHFVKHVRLMRNYLYWNHDIFPFPCLVCSRFNRTRLEIVYTIHSHYRNGNIPCLVTETNAASFEIERLWLRDYEKQNFYYLSWLPEEILDEIKFFIF